MKQVYTTVKESGLWKTLTRLESQMGRVLTKYADELKSDQIDNSITATLVFLKFVKNRFLPILDQGKRPGFTDMIAAIGFWNARKTYLKAMKPVIKKGSTLLSNPAMYELYIEVLQQINTLPSFASLFSFLNPNALEMMDLVRWLKDYLQEDDIIKVSYSGSSYTYLVICKDREFTVNFENIYYSYISQYKETLTEHLKQYFSSQHYIKEIVVKQIELKKKYDFLREKYSLFSKKESMTFDEEHQLKQEVAAQISEVELDLKKFLRFNETYPHPIDPRFKIEEGNLNYKIDENNSISVSSFKSQQEQPDKPLLITLKEIQESLNEMIMECLSNQTQQSTDLKPDREQIDSSVSQMEAKSLKFFAGSQNVQGEQKNWLSNEEKLKWDRSLNNELKKLDLKIINIKSKIIKYEKKDPILSKKYENLEKVTTEISSYLKTQWSVSSKSALTKDKLRSLILDWVNEIKKPEYQQVIKSKRGGLTKFFRRKTKTEAIVNQLINSLEDMGNSLDTTLKPKRSCYLQLILFYEYCVKLIAFITSPFSRSEKGDHSVGKGFLK